MADRKTLIRQARVKKYTELSEAAVQSYNEKLQRVKQLEEAGGEMAQRHLPLARQEAEHAGSRYSRIAAKAMKWVWPMAKEDMMATERFVSKVAGKSNVAGILVDIAGGAAERALRRRKRGPAA